MVLMFIPLASDRVLSRVMPFKVSINRSYKKHHKAVTESRVKLITPQKLQGSTFLFKHCMHI